MTNKTISKAGLEGVIAGESEICLIDGDNRKLFYRGYSVGDLARKASFEETSYLLLTGKLPNKQQLEEFSEELNKARYLPSQVLAMIALVPPHTHPMDMLRSIISSLSQHDPELSDNSPEANLKKSIRLISQASVIVAAYHRLRKGLQPIPPLKRLNLASNFLYMIHGEEANEYKCKTFDMCLTLHADHGFNASTFTARVVAATLSDMYSAVTAAIGALKGPLHGGANQRVMEMLREIGEIEEVDSFIRECFATGRKIPGFGHRIYRNSEDPRATILREACKEISEQESDTKWYDMSIKINRLVIETSEAKGKPIYPNVDFFSASTYSLLGIETELFTPIFAMARMAGWCSHVIEQHSKNRLIRPVEEYIGLRDQQYTPLEER